MDTAPLPSSERGRVASTPQPGLQAPDGPGNALLNLPFPFRRIKIALGAAITKDMLDILMR
jgi:hypothetical protein